MFHHLPSVGSKQLCALAHLECNRKAGTSILSLFQKTSIDQLQYLNDKEKVILYILLYSAFYSFFLLEEGGPSPIALSDSLTWLAKKRFRIFRLQLPKCVQKSAH